MTAEEILAEIEPLGLESYRKTLKRHGVQEPVFGVKIEEMKKIQRRVKKDYRLALDLFGTGIYDAMYLAGLIADDAKMTKKDLKGWLAQAKSPQICEYTIAWVAAGSAHGWELALEWIDAKKELVAVAGWSTLSSIASITPDADLDVAKLKELLQRVQKTIHQQPNRVRYVMNCFMIAVGSYVAELTEAAKQVATKVGKVEVDVGDTSCKIPDALKYIQMVQDRGSIGKKRKTAKC